MHLAVPFFRRIPSHFARITLAAVSVCVLATANAANPVPAPNCLFQRAITVQNWVRMNGSPSFDSFDSSQPGVKAMPDGTYGLSTGLGTFGNNGDVASNGLGDLSDLGHNVIFGRAMSNGGAMLNGENVQGTIISDFQTGLPPVPNPGWATGYTVLGPVHTATTLAASPDPLMPARYQAVKIDLGSANFLQIRNGNPNPLDPAYVEIWCTGIFRIAGQAQVSVDPNVYVKFFVAGDIDLGGGGIINNSDRSANVLLYGITPLDGTFPICQLHSAHALSAAVYAPAYDLVTSSSLPFCGAIVAKTATVGGSAGYHFDEALAWVAADVPVSPDIAVVQGKALTDEVGTVPFGMVMVGSSQSLTFTITDTGNTDIAGLVATTDGPNAADFGISALGRTSLAPGNSTTFTVGFAPSAGGSRTATIHIGSNVPGSKNPFDVVLTGTGNRPPVLTLPASPVVVEASSRGGALVSWYIDANDPEDGRIPYFVDHSNLSVFPLGETTVNVSATDLAGVSTTGAFVVRVQDTKPPIIELLGANPATAEVDSRYDDASASASDLVSGSITPVATGKVNTAVPGLYIITYTATDLAGNASTATRTVIVPHTPHADWRASAFGDRAGDASIAGDLADPNGNGLVNLLEYALGRDPLATSSDQDPITQLDATNRLSLSFARVLSHSDLTLTVQGADSPSGPWTDLAQSIGSNLWTTLLAGVTISESGADADTRSVVASDCYVLGEPGHPQRFLRLKVDR